MTKDFNDWWNSDLPSTNNPYTEDTPAYWAWAGWVAGAKAEREACAKVCDDVNQKTYDEPDDWSPLEAADACAAIIRARGEPGP